MTDHTTMPPVSCRSFNRWTSQIDSKMALARPGSAQWPERHGHGIYWVRALPEEGGRQVLVRRDPDGAEKVITPRDFNLRTRVHEYGGRGHFIDGEYLYFVNFDDQRLYRQSLDARDAPVPISDGSWMLADPVSVAGDWLVFVGERARAGGENENALVAIASKADGPGTVIVLADGKDFFACPVVSPRADRLAWFCWNHPDMPWDSSELYIGDIHATQDTISLDNVTSIAGGEQQSVCQLVFEQTGNLVFACDGVAADSSDEDEPDFWNLYRFIDGVESGKTSPVTKDKAEYGAAHWVFGHRRVVDNGHGALVAVRTALNKDELVIINNEDNERNGDIRCVETEAVHFAHLSTDIDGNILAVAEFIDQDSAVVQIDVASGELTVFDQAESEISKEMVSAPVQIACPTRDASTTYAWFYHPQNVDFVAPEGELPPLMVLVHGGPTSRAGSAFDLTRQYWTSRGFAVVDVNHRGSTGFGRHYRQALLGRWGEVDVDDVADVVEHLVSGNKVNGQSVFVRGSSAGGYVVLRALTRHGKLFAGGACYYGIGNLVTLARSTHKFESRYLDGLLGEGFDETRSQDTNYVYYTRSPINFIETLSNPMILFQGTDDRVVPPEVSREVVAVLKSLKLTHEYVEYEGEGHGFRKAENRVDALDRETEFHRSILKDNKA